MALTGRRALLLLVALVAIAVGAGACKPRPTRTLYLPSARGDLSLTLRYPPGISSTTACGTGAWLLRLDTAAHPSWDWTLLFDANFQRVYGAGGNASQSVSASTSFGLDFRKAVRVEVERVDQDAASVAGGQNVNVLCRGIADGLEVPGAIVIDTSALASATPAPSPTRVPVTVSVSVDMLRIGASNTLIDVGGLPQVRYPAAASLTSTRFGIGTGGTLADPRGDVLIAGGQTSVPSFPTSVWRFSPRTLTLNALTSTLTAGRGGLTATTIDDGGSAAVVFLGGYDGALKLNTADVIRADGSVDQGFLNLLTARAFATATFLRRAGQSVIVVAGGLGYAATGSHWPTDGSGDAITSIELIAPPGSTVCPPVSTSPKGCTGGTLSHLIHPRGLHSAARFVSADGERVWFAGGYNPADVATTSNSVEELLATLGSTGNIAFVPAFDSFGGDVAVLDSSGVPALDGRPILVAGFGGGVDPEQGSGSSALWYLQSGSGTMTTAKQLTATLGVARGQLRVVPLRDRSLWIGGGRDQGSTPPIFDLVEIFRPHTGDGNTDVGTITYSALPAQSCAGRDKPGCSNMLAARYGFAAVPLEGTRTWLDGAVLIVGGALDFDPGPTPPAELFVPAYACDANGAPRSQNAVASLPPVVPLSNPTLPDSCDLGRIAQPITDPRNGAAVHVP